MYLSSMLQKFSSYWWFLTLSGILFAALGAMLLFSNEFGLSDLLHYLGFVLVGMGVFTGLINYVMMRKESHYDWRWFALAAAELIMGLIILFNDNWAESTFIQMIGVWSIIMGAYLIYTGLKKTTKSIIVTLSGVISLAFGGLIFFDQMEEGNLHKLVGLYAILLGVFIVNGSLKIRVWKKNHEVDDKLSE